MMPIMHALITGGSSGIGKALAKQLAQRGYHISIIARDPVKLAAAVAEITACCQNQDQKILSFIADVADAVMTKQAVEQAIATLGAPTLLITSAGMAIPGYFQDLSMELFTQTMQVNFLGTVQVIKAALPTMQQAKMGRIVMISSGAGLTGVFGYTAYGASKFALRGFAESLRSELKPMGIGVSIVYPPDTDTPQLAAENKTKPPETKAISGSKPMSAEAVAKSILKGIRKKQFAIAPNLEMKLLMKFNSVVAPVLYWYFDRIVHKQQIKNQN